MNGWSWLLPRHAAAPPLELDQAISGCCDGPHRDRGLCGADDDSAHADPRSRQDQEASRSAALAGATAGACRSTARTGPLGKACPGSRSSPSTTGDPADKLPSGTKIKVWITADNDNSLRVLPASGLAVSDTAGHRYTVPAGAKYTSWRISRSGAGYRLSYRTSSEAM